MITNSDQVGLTYSTWMYIYCCSSWWLSGPVTLSPATKRPVSWRGGQYFTYRMARDTKVMREGILQPCTHCCILLIVRDIESHGIIWLLHYLYPATSLPTRSRAIPVRMPRRVCPLKTAPPSPSIPYANTSSSPPQSQIPLPYSPPSSYSSKPIYRYTTPPTPPVPVHASCPC